MNSANRLLTVLSPTWHASYRYCVLCIVCYILYIVHFISRIVYRVLYIVYFIFVLCIVYCIFVLYIGIVYFVFLTVYCVSCIVYFRLCVVYYDCVLYTFRTCVALYTLLHKSICWPFKYRVGCFPFKSGYCVTHVSSTPDWLWKWLTSSSVIHLVFRANNTKLYRCRELWSTCRCIYGKHAETLSHTHIHTYIHRHTHTHTHTYREGERERGVGTQRLIYSQTSHTDRLYRSIPPPYRPAFHKTEIKLSYLFRILENSVNRPPP